MNHAALVQFKRATAGERNRLAKEYRRIRKLPDGRARSRMMWRAEQNMGMFIAACIERQVYTGWLQ